MPKTKITSINPKRKWQSFHFFRSFVHKKCTRYQCVISFFSVDLCWNEHKTHSNWLFHHFFDICQFQVCSTATKATDNEEIWKSRMELRCASHLWKQLVDGGNDENCVSFHFMLSLFLRFSRWNRNEQVITVEHFNKYAGKYAKMKEHWKTRLFGKLFHIQMRILLDWSYLVEWHRMLPEYIVYFTMLVFYKIMLYRYNTR